MSSAAGDVGALFLAALEVDPAVREAFLVEACDDPDLRAEVARLLEHDELAEATRFLEESPASPALRAGSRVGSYQVVGLVGEGGMGEVYLVEPKIGPKRPLALKVIKLGMDSQRVLARFEVERQTLGRMDHPGIARVLDAGRNARGQPYFVMEFVDGSPITDHCERHGLTVESRLHLFLDVCKAVQHAHQAGVMHRDLKPSNILISEEGGRTQPKVIDFGLARATDHRLDHASALTDFGQVLGTPEYMSPEQVEGAPLHIDTRSDIYSLGAILYELLTATCPFEELRASGDEGMRRRIREENPAAPSVRVRAAGTGQSGQSGDRVRRSKRLRGDLDVVTMKALAKRPEDRFQTVGDLAADIDRYLRGQPVSARRASRAYLAGKFLRRHRAGVVAAVVVVLAVLGGLVGTSLGLAAAESARREAQRSLDGFNLLAWGVRIKRAVADEKSLYPAWPHMAPRLQQWIDEQAEPLMAISPRITLALAQIRQRALPYDADMRARDAHRFAADREELEQLIGRRDAVMQRDDCSPEITRLKHRIHELRQRVETRGIFAFENEMDHVLHDGLARVCGDLNPFNHGNHSLVADVRDRLDWALRVHEETIDRCAQAWQRAAEEVAADPRFSGFELTPQLGLIPLGADPESGLQEFAHPRSGKPVVRDPSSGQLRVTEDSGLAFVLLPGGIASTGAQSANPNSTNYDPHAKIEEGPVHQVTLAPFFFAKYEMTQAQWSLLARGDNPSHDRPGLAFGRRVTGAHPVENVSWVASRDLLRKQGLRLPSEAEWEFACRAGTEAAWWTGMLREAVVASANVSGSAAHDAYDGHASAPAGRPNPFGLVNVHGNVAEWCADGYDSYGVRPRAEDGLRELANRSFRVVRGGDFSRQPALARSAARLHRHPDSRDGTTGVRPARSMLR